MRARSGPDRASEAGASRLRLQTSIRLRWYAVAGQLIAVVFVFWYLGFDLPVGLCLLLIATSAWLNVALRMRFSPIHRPSPRTATTMFAYDILQLGGLLYLTGGIDNPFTVLLVAPVTVSAATLPERNTFALGMLALGVTIAVAIIHEPLPWYTGAELKLPAIYRAGIFASVFACLLFLALYAWRLAKEAEQMSTALAATELVLAREQRLHALDGLAAAAAHELGTPLATIYLIASELEKDISDRSRRSAAGQSGGGADGDLPPDLEEDLSLLKTQATRCREILQKLTRAPSINDPLHASVTLLQIADEAAGPHRDAGVEINLVTSPVSERPAPTADRKPGVLYGVGNVIENAVDFATSRVDVAAAWSEDEVVLEISDDGPGFPSDILDQIGDPYVSTRQTRHDLARKAERAGGLGLGVFIAKTLLERSGATLTPSNKTAPERGAIVRIAWPRSVFEQQS
ncbi:MAG: ActS/PrrB/RegB family redox-sensitive histidine kinase [Pseudomonadota bacterium]